MKEIQKRFLLFLIGCIGTRLLFVYIAKHINIQYLPYLGYLALLPAVGFTYLYVFGLRKTGPEVFGDKIWWNDMRPFHALFYYLFAFFAIFKNKKAWVFLLLDVLLGFLSFVSFHFTNGDFAKVFK
jgi:hypothetical protein